MPVDTTTISVGEIVDELDDRLDQIAAEADALEDADPDDPDSPDEPAARQQELDQQGIRLDQRLAAFEELAEEHGRDAEFEIAELTLDERMRFNDLLEAARDQAEQRQAFEPGSSMRDIYWTGAGVVDAPWLDGEEDMFKRVAALRSEEIDVDWRVYQFLKAKVTEANSKGNPERRNYAERREARTSANTPN